MPQWEKTVSPALKTCLKQIPKHSLNSSILLNKRLRRRPQSSMIREETRMRKLASYDISLSKYRSWWVRFQRTSNLWPSTTTLRNSLTVCLLVPRTKKKSSRECRVSRKRDKKNARNKPNWRHAIKISRYLREATSWAANKNPELAEKKENKLLFPILILSWIFRRNFNQSLTIQMMISLWDLNTTKSSLVSFRRSKKITFWKLLECRRVNKSWNRKNNKWS